MDNNEEMKEWLGTDEKVRESGGKKSNSIENEAANLEYRSQNNDSYETPMYRMGRNR